MNQAPFKDEGTEARKEILLYKLISTLLKFIIMMQFRNLRHLYASFETVVLMRVNCEDPESV